MRWLDISTENCSIQRALDIVGDRWSLLILREAFNGVRRFDDMAGHLGISDSVLSRRLRGLVEGGVLRRVAYRSTGARTHHEYVLTERGLDLFPAIVALMQWGDKYLADEEGGTWKVAHKTCGHPVEAVVHCTHDLSHLTPFDTETGPGPSARERAPL